MMYLMINKLCSHAEDSVESCAEKSFLDDAAHYKKKL